MNYFFFLDTDEEDLTPSVEVFNRPPAKRLSADKLKSKNIIAFYSYNNVWNYHLVSDLKPNCSLLIKKTDLPNEFKDKSVFLFLSDLKNFDKNVLKNENYMNCSPAWRANIKISSDNNSVSYQGEYPHIMTEKKLSLVSCSPMVQNNQLTKTFFYLVNLKSKPDQNNFKVKIMNINKQIIEEVHFKTNKINFINLEKIDKKDSQLTYIFSSEEEGGVPIYFSKSIDNKFFSLEHTHPPTEYTFEGNRLFFQKKKKSFWHS
jgi:hypothetical protein